MALTKKEMFGEIIKFAQGEKISVDKTEIVNFCEHEVELLTKKAGTAKKPTKTQKENEVFKQDILDTLTKINAPATISKIMEKSENLAGLTNQRVSALLTQLKNAGMVIRTEYKKKAYFAIAPTEDENSSDKGEMVEDGEPAEIE